MYITDIVLDGVYLDMSPEESLDFTAQVNTIAAIDSRQASYSPSYKLPKTSKNVRALGGLGMASDSSSIPYKKPNCMLFIEGFAFIVNGWLNVKETTQDYYSIYIYSGIVNFFKAIENKTLGDLDLSALDHVKNLNSVVASFSNPAYKYLITDYNGLSHYGQNSDVINIDYLIPSASVAFLWDKIFTTYGFSYEGSVFSLEDFSNLWLSYPKYIAVDGTTELINTSGSRYVDTFESNGNEANYYRGIFAPALVDGRSFTAPETGKYKISLHVVNSYQFPLSATVVYRMSINQEGINYINRSNVIVLGSYPASAMDQTMTSFVTLNAGDIISFYDYMYMNGFLRWGSSWDIKIEKVVEGVGDFSEELKDFQISDFCKDIFNRFCLTPFADEFSDVIKFKTITERIVDAPVIDWTDRYVARTSEEYTSSTYAIKNKFQYQYNDKEATYHDGNLLINNTNLDAEKVVFKSKTYSPEKSLTDFNIGAGSKLLRVFKIYEKEPKEEAGVTEINYKGLDKRFHFLKKLDYNAGSSVPIGSLTFSEQTSVSSLPLASFEGQDWASLLGKYYPNYGSILNESRMHEIDLHLRDMDLLTLNLEALYYFAQEQQFYILDKLKFKGGKISSGAFIRVKPDEVGVLSVPVDPTDPTDTDIVVLWGDNTSTAKIGYADSIVLKIQGISFPSDDELIGFEWERLSGGSWVGLGTGASPYTAILQTGSQSYRIRATSENNNIFYSNILEYTRPAIVCKRYFISTFANSGDDLSVFWVDCNGVNQSSTQYASGGGGSQLSLTFCALEGQFSHNSPQAVLDQGSC